MSYYQNQVEILKETKNSNSKLGTQLLVIHFVNLLRSALL